MSEPSESDATDSFGPEPFEPDPQDVRRFGAALGALDAALDWEELGRAYCHAGGEEFFPAEQRAAIADAGLQFAADLGQVLAPRGRSLYVGAGVAELAPLAFERLVLHRAVHAIGLDGPETRALNRGFAAVEAELELALLRIETTPLAQLEARAFDHGWMVSVLNDPEAFPALSASLYERGTPEPGEVERDAARARELARELLARLACGGAGARLSTSDDELRLLAPLCAELALQLRVPERARLSPVVGDAVRLCRVVAAPAASG